MEADIDRAVMAARKAFDQLGWATSAPAGRAAAINRFADALERRAGDLARSVTLQNGMPIALAEALEGGFGVGFLRYYAGLAAAMPAASAVRFGPPSLHLITSALANMPTASPWYSRLRPTPAIRFGDKPTTAIRCGFNWWVQRFGEIVQLGFRSSVFSLGAHSVASLRR